MKRHSRPVRIGHITIALFAAILFAIELQAAAFSAKFVGAGSKILDINEKGEYIGAKRIFTKLR